MAAFAMHASIVCAEKALRIVLLSIDYSPNFQQDNATLDSSHESRFCEAQFTSAVL
jgi:hypothetical protein